MNKVVKFFLLSWIVINIITALLIWNYPNSKNFQKADVALILGTSVINNLPSQIFAARLDHGIYLYKAGKVSKILITGGKGTKVRLSEAEAGKKYALKKGVLEKNIIIENKSTTTQENLRFSKNILKKENPKSVVIITDPMHMKRAMLIARTEGIRAIPSPTPFTQFKTLDRKLLFLLTEIPKLQFQVINPL